MGPGPGVEPIRTAGGGRKEEKDKVCPTEGHFQDTESNSIGNKPVSMLYANSWRWLAMAGFLLFLYVPKNLEWF